jgi:hypothetical protein
MRRAGWDYPEPLRLGRGGWLLALVAAAVFVAALAGCDDQLPCRDEVLNPRVWWGNARCLHKTHELALVDMNTWVCRCPKEKK